MTYRMIWNQRAYFGAGSIAEIPHEITDRGFRSVLVVTDAVLVDSGVAGRVTDLLGREGISYAVFSDIAPNPPITNVLAGLAALEASGADAIVAVGGGSAMDTAKAIGIIAANPEYADVRSLEGVAATRNPSLPLIAVPTTAGTASETTINYVITDTERERKFVCVDPHDIPLVAVVDVEMMASSPRGLKAATGLDALTHAIEGYTTKGAWELSDLFHLHAIRIIASSLRQSVDGDQEAGERMALAQYIAGMGYSNVGLGLVHGMAHPLGAQYQAPHGVANGLLLAAVMEYNADATGERFRDIADAFGVAGAYSLALPDARRAAVAAVRELVSDLGNPTRLGEIGVSAEGIDALAEAAFADVCTGGNPREATVSDIAELYRSLL